MTKTHCKYGHELTDDNLCSALVYQGRRRCRICRNSYMRDRRKTFKQTDPVGSHRFNKNAKLVEKYGITLERFEQMLIEQDNKCAICGIEFTDVIKACTDHCHETEKVRALLCHPCNRSIGLMKENITAIEKMADYLKSHQEVHNGN